jgi:HK97 family phage portal protein
MPLTASLVNKRFHPSQDPPDWFREYVAGLGGWGQSAAGVTVTPDTAMRVTGALACIRTIADTEASLPFFTYRRLKRGKEKAPDHYLYPILHDAANPEMSAFTYRRTISAHVASRGNGLSEIEFDGGGRVKALWPLNPDKVRLERDPRSRRLFYFYTLPESEGGQGVRLPAERIFHIKWLSQNGLWGMSPVQLASESIGISLAAQDFMGRFFQNDATPRGVLETDAALSDKAWSRLESDWEDRHGGLTNKHRLAILEEGLKYHAITLSPQDIMLLDLMKFGIADVGRIWGISLDMLNETDKAATYASVEQFGIRFTVHTVRPWTVNWEQEAHRSLLTKSERKEYFVEHAIDGLLRGDFKTRTEGYNGAITTGWMVRNEARELENLNPREDMDEPLVQLNMAPATQREVMLPIYRDVFGRIARRESHDLDAASKRFKDNPQKLSEWRREFLGDDHSQFVVMQLVPALKAHLALSARFMSDADLETLAGDLARKYCADVQNGNVNLMTYTWPEIMADRSLA